MIKIDNFCDRGNGGFFFCREIFLFLLVSFNFSYTRELENFDQLKWALRAGSIERPNMSAVLIYNSEKILNQDLERMIKIFNKVSHNQAYRDFADFLRLDLKKGVSLDYDDLNKLINLENIPLIALFNNFELIDVLSGFRLSKFRNIVNFVNNGFKDQIKSIKVAQQNKDEEIIRLTDYPPYYYGASFGEPFYSSYFGRQFYGGYLYPYNYSIYFNTAFFTQMSV